MSHSELLVLFLLTVQSFSIFGCKKYNQSDFSVDNLVMSMCRVFSCVVGRDSLGQTLLAFALLHSVFQGQFAYYSRCFLTSYFCIPVSCNEKDIFFGYQLQKVLQFCIEWFNFSFFSITGRGIDLDYSDIELQLLVNY